MGSNASDNYFRNDLINRITKADRSVVSNGFRPLNLGNEDNVSFIQVIENALASESFQHFLYD